MSKGYDEALKKFVGANPQDFVAWLYAGAAFQTMLPTELKSRNVFVDSLCKVEQNGQEFALHLEFQRNIRSDIPERLLEYNILASREYKLRVCSCVIYLVDDGIAEVPPLVWSLPDGSLILSFHYTSVKLWEVNPDEFTRPRREGILPMVILTRDNTRPDVVEMVIQRLLAVGKRDLLFITKLLASLVFKNNQGYSEWLDRRFAMLSDILRETDAYQQVFREGSREGRKTGLEEGALLMLRQNIHDIIEERFPTLIDLAQEKIQMTTNTNQLSRLLRKISVLSEEQTKQLLVEFGTAE